MGFINRDYLTPLRGRIFLGLATASFSIYIYNNYNNLPTFKQLKDRFFATYFKTDRVKTIINTDTDTNTDARIDTTNLTEPIMCMTQPTQIYETDSSNSTPCETPKGSTSHTNSNSV